MILIKSDNDFNIYKESKISKIKEFENPIYSIGQTRFLGIKMISSMKIKYEFLQETIIIKKDDIKDDRVWLQYLQREYTSDFKKYKIIKI